MDCDHEPDLTTPLSPLVTIHDVNHENRASFLLPLLCTSLYSMAVMKTQFTPIILLFFPYIFDTITTKRWQVANKETLLRHSQALWPSRPPWSTWPSWLTQHYQDYDVNYDDRAAYSCSHSIRFPIQCSLLWPALLSLLSFYQHSSITRLSLSGFSSFLHYANCLLYSLVITQQVMCALFSTIALASLHNTCGSYITIVILHRHLLRHAALPHVVLLHSVTSLQYKWPDLVGKVFPIFVIKRRMNHHELLIGEHGEWC